MQARHTGLAAALLLTMVALIIVGGRVVEPDSPQITVDPIAPEDLPPTGDTGLAQAQDAPPQSDEWADTDMQAQPSLPTIDPERAAPPATAEQPLERIAPRPPLSDLALATPPKPKLSGDWKGTTLFRPFASSAGVVAAQRFSVTVAGIDVVSSDETCHDHGETWNCGQHALGAFRSFLRGLAIVCAIPPEADHGDFTVRCRSGKKDIGEWLVENGWARATAGGPYEDAGKKARQGRKGIYGGAPDTDSVPPVTGSTEMAPPPSSGSILDLSGEAPPPATPPVDPPAPFQ